MHKFVTAETQIAFLQELTELRDALGAIKRDAEQYVADSVRTTVSLGTLTESLGKLRALKIYQKQANAKKDPDPVETALKNFK